MADPRPPPPIDELPEALPDRRHRVRLPFVWILPAIVIVAGAFVAVHEKLAEGVPIEITFHTADDLEPNKTKISYKAVEIGQIKGIHVSKDRKDVVVEARIHRDARDYLVQDTRFWVVRPRVTGSDISGLGTLVSGAYISVDVGHSSVPAQNFTGLEVPPIVTSGLPGREYVLHAKDIGSLSIGSAVFYRHIAAGQVVAYSLDPNGDSVTIKVFINSPYDQFVTHDTRFWQASGIDMSIDSEGVKLHTESLASILQGGVAFQPIKGAPPAPQSPVDSSFALYSDRERAMREPDTVAQTFVMYFQGSLRGLTVGAPVDLSGINIGEVKHLSVEYDRDAGVLRFPVEVDIFPQRIRGRPRTDRGTGSADDSDIGGHAMIDSMVAHGMRAELKTGSLLTGQKFVSVEVEKRPAADRVDWSEHPPIFPTAAGGLDEIQDSVGSIAKKLDKVPFDQLSTRLMATLAALQDTLKSTDQVLHQVNGTIAPQVTATLKEAAGRHEECQRGSLLGGAAAERSRLDAARAVARGALGERARGLPRASPRSADPG